MRIKLGIVDEDVIYLQKLVSTFGKYYSDKLEIYSYSDVEYAIDKISKQRHDVVLVDSKITSFDVKNCCIAYMVDTSDIDQINGTKAICKFQKTEMIYKDILNLYAEHSALATKKKKVSQDAEIISFASPISGVGNSSVAVAFAINCALNNKSAFYLNLETLPSTSVFMKNDSKYTMSDVIYAVKSKKNNLSMKLESFVSTDSVGFDYYADAENTMDLHELNEEDIETLIKELKIMGLYDYIIVDCNFEVSNKMKKILSMTDKFVCVTNLDEKSEIKMSKARDLLNIYMGEGFFEKSYVIVNNCTVCYDDATQYNVIANMEHMETYTARQMAEYMANNQTLTNLY
ncbi:MAG: hypothetical protein E7258_06025 [Lachnospiraceae bacterium]|nr:hypothetical protein [Lachnospiraceae bacterium]